MPLSARPSGLCNPLRWFIWDCEKFSFKLLGGFLESSICKLDELDDCLFEPDNDSASDAEAKCRLGTVILDDDFIGNSLEIRTPKEVLPENSRSPPLSTVSNQDAK